MIRRIRAGRPGKDLIGSLPTAGGGIAKAAYRRAVSASVDVGTLAAGAGLRIEQFQDPDARIRVDRQIRFLNLAAEALQDDYLGFHLAKEIDLRELGLLYYVQASSESIGDALRRVERYCSLQNEGVLIRCARGKSASIAFEYNGIRRLSDTHQMEFYITCLVRLGRHFAARHLLPRQIRLTHRRLNVSAEFKSFFGCEIHFGSLVDEIEYPAMLPRLPIVSADMYLNRILTKYCEEALAGRRRRAKVWRLSVENTLSALLPHGLGTRSEVSKHLGISGRTLVRRLASEGTKFSDIVDGLRLALAKRYLGEPGLPISEIAWLLGYGDATAFTHAFKRWTGKSPKALRI